MSTDQRSTRRGRTRKWRRSWRVLCQQIREVPEKVGLGSGEGLGGFCVTAQRRGRTRKWRRSWRVLCHRSEKR